MKKHISIFLTLLASACLLTSCKDDQPVNPSLETLEVTATSASTFLAKGNINAIGSNAVKDYGFVYSLSYENPDLFQGTTISLGSKPLKGPFEKDISISSSSGYYNNNMCYVRAYLTNDRGTVYGKVKIFKVPILTVSNISPLTGKVGDVIIISGTNFSPIPENNQVKFSDVKARIKSATSTQLQVEVPAGVSSNNYYYPYGVTVAVTAGSQTAQATQSFKIIPTVTDFSPKSGSFSTLVTIVGSDFNGHSISIKIGNATVSPSGSATANTVTFQVPGTVTTETSKISISFDNGNFYELPGTFTIVPPTITSLSPSTGLSGSIVTIAGSNFNSSNSGYYYTNYNTVKFGSVPVTNFVSYSSSEIKVYVPTGLAIGGHYDVTVNTGVHTIKASTQFTLVSPSFGDFSPKTGTAYSSSTSYITVTGSNFGNVTGTVSFGNYNAGIFSWSDTSIQVQLPYMSAGNYKITVSAGGQSCTSTDMITIN